MEQILPGIWRLSFGEAERFTPVTLREIPPDREGLAKLDHVDASPFDLSRVRFNRTVRGCVVEIPMGDGEQIYGFGLQLKSLIQTAKKRIVRVNSDPNVDTGDSHAPVPFYVSTAGYGVLIDTARYVAVNVGSHVKVGQGTPARGGAAPSGSTDELYRARALDGRYVVADIPTAAGVDIYIFAGPDLRQAVQRYNLFSGGGCLPTLWGLGVWYRAFTGATSDEILATVRGFREQNLPIDVLGLEPGWQGQSYSCSYLWSKERFPDPQTFLADTQELGFRVNLWEHAFVHPTSPIYESLRNVSGDYEVWGGLIPDLSVSSAREVFGEFHAREFVARGISGFKLDECDNSDLTPWFWSFPEATSFPSGMDGEQMHSFLGIYYQRTIDDAFRRHNLRTYSLARSSHALASPYPFVIYSDLYDHRDFVRGVTTMGFGGVLWTPEVREGVTPEGLIRRIQSVVMSPMALINAWYIKSPPWVQVDMDKNNRGEPSADAPVLTEAVARLFRLRMSLLPYLYSAFARYRYEGLPPFRALVMDDPTDVNCQKIDDAYLMGDNLLVAPMFVGQTERDVYLPAGRWFDFDTNAVFEGGQTHRISASLEKIPIFVRDGTILPLADPLEHISREAVFDLRCRVYGTSPKPFILQEDDGETRDVERGVFNRVTLRFENGQGSISRTGSFPAERYRVKEWDVING